LPIYSRKYTYGPPAAGYIAASSAIDNAPNSATMPPSIHTSAMPVRLPVSAAMPEGTRKMPLPMITPITTAMPVTRPSLRGSSRGDSDDAVMAESYMAIACSSYRLARDAAQQPGCRPANTIARLQAEFDAFPASSRLTDE